jgi:hypothetical protein
MAQHPSFQVSSPPACRFQAWSAWKRWGQVLIPGTVLPLAPLLALAPLAITVSAITEPAIAGDSTRSMPANREGLQPRHPRAARNGWMSWPRCHGFSALIAGRVGSGFWRALQSRPHRIV